MRLSALALHPLTWAAAWIAAYAIAAVVQASLHERAPANRFERWAWATMHDRMRSLALRTVFLVSPLVLASWLRLADPARLGLIGPARWAAVPLSALLVVAAVGVTVLGARHYVRATDRSPAARSAPDRRRTSVVALDALSLEAYWAFLRGAVLSVGLGNTTLAVFLALGLLALQAWSNPARRADFLEPDDALRLTRGAGLAILSAMVFLASGSLAVCLLAHAGADLALDAFSYAPSARLEADELGGAGAPEPRDALPEPTIV